MHRTTQRAMAKLIEFEDALQPRPNEGPATRRARAAGLDIEQLEALSRLTPADRLRRLEEALQLRAHARRAGGDA